MRRREHAGLAGARAREHEQRAVDVQHGLALRRVQPRASSVIFNRDMAIMAR